MSKFPEPPRVEELDGVSAKLRQNLQRWMSDLKRWGSSSGGGTVTSITATSPIVVTPSPITTTGVVSHATSGVTAASYGDASHYTTFTVDADGHLTAAASVALPAGGTGTVTSVGLAMPTGWTVTGSPVTTTGTLTAASPLTTKGDLYVFAAHDDRLAIGTNGNVLTADSTQASGMKWAPVSAGPSTFDWGKYIAGKACPI